MNDEDRKDFDQVLDVLAGVLRVTPLEQYVKNEYWQALRCHSIEGFIRGMQRLRETYKPHYKTDYPPPAIISEVIGGVFEKGDTWNCRCCGMAFIAGKFDTMRCGCSKDYCYDCGKCGMHCQHEEVVDLMESAMWAGMRVVLLENPEVAKPVIKEWMKKD